MQEFIAFLRIHWVLTLIFIIVTVVLLILEAIKQKQSATQLSPAQATQMMNHENAVIVDIRTTALFNEGHIIGAQSIPLAELQEKSKKLEKSKNKPIVLVCMNGSEAPKVADTLKKQGLNIYTLSGGMRAWREAEMPIVKD